MTTIYLAAPPACWQTDRYEQYYFLISHHFSGAEIIESSHEEDWPSTLERISALVFIRDAKLIDSSVWKVIKQAHEKDIAVFLAATIGDNQLLLTEFDDVSFKAQGKGKRLCTIKQKAVVEV